PALPGSPSRAAQRSMVPGGPPGFIPGQPPEDEGKPVHQGQAVSRPVELTASLASPGILSNGYDYPPPETTYFVYDKIIGTGRTPYPYKAIGRVFFTANDGNDYVCSGASI